MRFDRGRNTICVSSLKRFPISRIISQINDLVIRYGIVGILRERDADFLFLHEKDGKELASLDTRAMRDVLGEEVPLDTFEVIVWMRDMLREQYENS